MTKIKGPLLSESAHGTVGGLLTYSHRGSGAQVRFQHKQIPGENAAQKLIRDAFRYGVILWGSLPAEQKAYWDEIESRGYADV